MELRGLAGGDCRLCSFACAESEGGFSEPLSVDIRLGKIHGRGLVWKCGDSRASFRQLVCAGRFQSGGRAAGAAVSGMAAVLCDWGDAGGCAGIGGGVLYCQPGAELPTAARTRAALGGSAGRYADGDESLPLLL